MDDAALPYLPIIDQQLFSNDNILKLLINGYEDLVEEFSCNICSELVFKKEMVQCKEGHSSCKPCMEEHLKNKKECMVCQYVINSIDDLSRNRFIEQTFANKKMKCPFSFKIDIYIDELEFNNQVKEIYKDIDHGCKNEIKIGEFETHLLNCDSRFIRCTSDGCNQVFRFKELDTHLSDCGHSIISCEYCSIDVKRKECAPHQLNECPSVEINCYQCSKKIKRGELDKHINESCTDTIIECKYKEFGCTVKFKRIDLSWHYEKINHSNYITSKLKSLEDQFEQLYQLQDKLTSTQNELSTLKNENITLQQALSERDKELINLKSTNDIILKRLELLESSNKQINEVSSTRLSTLEQSVVDNNDRFGAIETQLDKESIVSIYSKIKSLEDNLNETISNVEENHRDVVDRNTSIYSSCWLVSNCISSSSPIFVIHGKQFYLNCTLAPTLIISLNVPPLENESTITFKTSIINLSSKELNLKKVSTYSNELDFLKTRKVIIDFGIRKNDLIDKNYIQSDSLKINFEVVYKEKEEYLKDPTIPQAIPKPNWVTIMNQINKSNIINK